MTMPRLSVEHLRQSAVWLAIAATLMVMLVVQPALVMPEQWPILLRQAAPIGVLAIGQTILLIGRGFDLSVGGVVGFVSVLSAGPLAQTHGAGAVVVLCVLFGLAVGLVNGVMVSFGRISPLVATLGTGFVLTGAMLIYTGGAPTGRIPDAIRLLSGGRLLGIPIAVHVWLVLALLAGLMLRRAWFGRYVYAIGSSPRAAVHAGVPVAVVEIASYVIASLCAVIGGLLLAGFVGVGTLGRPGADVTCRRRGDRRYAAHRRCRRHGRTVGGSLLTRRRVTGAGAGAAGSSFVQDRCCRRSLLFRGAVADRHDDAIARAPSPKRWCWSWRGGIGPGRQRRRLAPMSPPPVTTCLIAMASERLLRRDAEPDARDGRPPSARFGVSRPADACHIAGGSGRRLATVPARVTDTGW